MSEATEGSVAPETASAGNPEGATVTRMDGSGGSADVDLWSGLQDEGNRALVEAKGWKSKGLDDVLASYRALESRLGQALVPPGKDASVDEWNAFYARLGRPEKPEGYEFRMPEGLPEDVPYDGRFAETAKAWFHEAGLPPSQAQMLHDRFVAYAAEQHKALQEAQVKSMEEAHRAITREWGDPDSEGYRRKVELAERAARKLGMMDALKRRGVLSQDGAVMDAEVVMALAKVGEAMFAEDALHGGPSAMRNPWSSDHYNLTEQGRLIRQDPELAKAFIRSAGLKVEDYFRT